MKNLLPSQLCNLFKTSFRLSSCAVFFIFCFLLGWFPASGLIGSIFTSRNRFSTTMSTSSTGSVSTENLIKVLEIPLPFQSKTRENDYDDWQRQEQQRMLNQMFIAQSITSGTVQRLSWTLVFMFCTIFYTKINIAKLLHFVSTSPIYIVFNI